MKKILTVLKNEFLTVVTRKSFILTLVLIPLTSFIVLLVVSGLQKKAGIDTGKLFENLFSPSKEAVVEGFIDQSQLMKTVPAGFEEVLIRYDSEQDARDAIQSGNISAYYLVSEDFLQSGDVIYVRPDFNPMGSTTQTNAIDALISYNLTNGNIDLAYRVQNPINATEVNISNTEQRDTSHWLTFFLPYIVTFLFYIVILTSSSLMLNSITNEKQNRVLEILLTSVTPTQMLTGKIIALGLTGLLQTVVWMGAGMLMLKFSGSAFNLSAAFQLPISVLVWGIVFFILGYAVYASLMAGIGALVPNMRESSQLTTIVILPMVVPLVFISALITTPNSPLATFLSLFPLTSPVSMMTRLSATAVPFWQVGISVILLIATAVLLVRASAGLFRAQNLLSGKTVTAKDFMRALSGK